MHNRDFTLWVCCDVMSVVFAFTFSIISKLNPKVHSYLPKRYLCLVTHMQCISWRDGCDLVAATHSLSGVWCMLKMLQPHFLVLCFTLGTDFSFGKYERGEVGVGGEGEEEIIVLVPISKSN